MHLTKLFLFVMLLVLITLSNTCKINEGGDTMIDYCKNLSNQGLWDLLLSKGEELADYNLLSGIVKHVVLKVYLRDPDPHITGGVFQCIYTLTGIDGNYDTNIFQNNLIFENEEGYARVFAVKQSTIESVILYNSYDVLKYQYGNLVTDTCTGFIEIKIPEYYCVVATINNIWFYKLKCGVVYANNSVTEHSYRYSNYPAGWVTTYRFSGLNATLDLSQWTVKTVLFNWPSGQEYYSIKLQNNNFVYANECIGIGSQPSSSGLIDVGYLSLNVNLNISNMILLTTSNYFYDEMTLFSQESIGKINNFNNLPFRKLPLAVGRNPLVEERLTKRRVK